MKYRGDYLVDLERENGTGIVMFERFKRVEEEVFNSKEDGRCIEITICTEAKVEEISLQRE